MLKGQSSSLDAIKTFVRMRPSPSGSAAAYSVQQNNIKIGRDTYTFDFVGDICTSQQVFFYIRVDRFILGSV
jgi:hypothetical protein